MCISASNLSIEELRVSNTGNWLHILDVAHLNTMHPQISKQFMWHTFE